MTAPLALDTKLGAAASSTLLAARPPKAVPSTIRSRAQAEEFETVFVNSMFQHMFTGIDGEGPFGNSTGVGVWRSFLTDEYAKTFVKTGGLGLADHVYKALLAQQEARAK